MRSCGTCSAYVGGCRCRPCRDAAARYERYRQYRRAQGRPLHHHPCAVQRRVQALAAMGWTVRAIARDAGVAESALWRSYSGNVRWVADSTYQRVRAAYDRLSMVHGPSTRARRHAERNGWPPPLAWDNDADLDDPDAGPACPPRPLGHRHVDRVVVALAVTGQTPPRPLTNAEREAAVRRLAGRHADSEIATRIRATVRTVLRIRTRLGLPAADRAGVA